MIETEEAIRTTCPVCGDTFEQVTSKRGHRPKEYCSDRCRQRHKRQQDEAQAQAHIARLEKEIEELKERLDIEKRYRLDTEVRHFKNWIRKHPQARDTDFFKRFDRDTRLPPHASRAMYSARLKQYGYSAEEIALFEEAWKDMLFQS